MPFWFLHRISDVLFLLFYYVVQYRKKVVLTNLKNSFPDKTAREIAGIAKKFYRHFCDLIIESIRLFSIPYEELMYRCRFVNPEILNRYYEQGKSLIIVAGHYGNWEIFGQACNTQMKHQAVGIYKPLRSSFFDKKFAESRGRYKVVLLPKNQVKDYFCENKDQVKAVIFGSDQAPSPSTKRVYWTSFLNQDTAVMYGAEKYAREYDYPVFFTRIRRKKRSQYEVEFELLEEHPASLPQGIITEKHVRSLEQLIQEKPEFYLWTHKRWK
ncbi:MAG: lysophospholipid acyltransferase family protein, partial [Phaeodactylibacter sp.]|nr:lysophospholipid acyltransferase family protein [Phaeodactylibacter sp.]